MLGRVGKLDVTAQTIRVVEDRDRAMSTFETPIPWLDREGLKVETNMGVMVEGKPRS